MHNGNGRVRRIRLGHRNIGIVLSLFLLLLVVTGFLLNHAGDFGLDESSVPASIANRYYTESAVVGHPVDERWLYNVGDTLYLDQETVGFCEGGLAGAAGLGDFIIAACADELTLLTLDGIVVENLGSSHGVPTGIEGLAVVGDELMLHTAGGVIAFDLQSLSATRVDAMPVFPEPVEVPAAVLMRGAITWERFILDLHSGRYLGEWGVWLSDFIALLLAVLAVSGVTLSVISRPTNGNGSCR